MSNKANFKFLILKTATAQFKVIFFYLLKAAVNSKQQFNNET